MIYTPYMHGKPPIVTMHIGAPKSMMSVVAMSCYGPCTRLHMTGSKEKRPYQTEKPQGIHEVDLQLFRSLIGLRFYKCRSCTLYSW
jgi:hypothetical protein